MTGKMHAENKNRSTKYRARDATLEVADHLQLMRFGAWLSPTKTCIIQGNLTWGLPEGLQECHHTAQLCCGPPYEPTH